MPDATIHADDPSGAERREAIARAVRTSELGWLRTNDLAEKMDLDRSTVNYHASKLLEMGLVATGYLRRIGHPGRPSRVVLDPERLPDIPRTFDLQEHHERPDGKTVILTFSYTIESIETPAEFDPSHRNLPGPVSRALMSGDDRDTIVRAVSQQVADALLTDIKRGAIELVIRPATAASTTTPTDTADPEEGDPR